MDDNKCISLLTAAARYVLVIAVVFAGAACDDDDDTPLKPTTVTPEPELKVDTLKLLSYNILEAMKLDTETGKPTFVNWIKELDPDIIAFQEANRWTQHILEGYAERWGHKYVVTNVKTDDNYPVAITSKYPIEVRNKITAGVSHGAIHVKIRDVNIVTLHLWPQSYGDAGGVHATGDAYRLYEIETFLAQTRGYYPDETRWLMMGDFNAQSRLDYDDLSSPSTRNYEVHDTILASGYRDTMREYYSYFVGSGPTRFDGATNNNQWRIDFIYGTDEMIRDMTYVNAIKDQFTHYYSDHYPVYMEFISYTETAGQNE